MKIVLHVDLKDMKPGVTVQDVQKCLQALMRNNGIVKKL